MPRLGLLLIAFFISLPTVRAADNEVVDEAPPSSEDVLEEEKVNIFGYPDESMVEIIDNRSNDITSGRTADMPSCDDSRLMTQVQDFLAPYLKSEQGTAIEKRRIALLRKGLRKFNELTTDKITPQEDLAAADRLIELKINNKLATRDIKICRSALQNEKSNIYLVMYFANNRLVIELLNFLRLEELKFDFKP